MLLPQTLSFTLMAGLPIPLPSPLLALSNTLDFISTSMVLININTHTASLQPVNTHVSFNHVKPALRPNISSPPCQYTRNFNLHSSTVDGPSPASKNLINPSTCSSSTSPITWLPFPMTSCTPRYTLVVLGFPSYPTLSNKINGPYSNVSFTLPDTICNRTAHALFARATRCINYHTSKC